MTGTQTQPPHFFEPAGVVTTSILGVGVDGGTQMPAGSWRQHAETDPSWIGISPDEQDAFADLVVHLMADCWQHCADDPSPEATYCGGQAMPGVRGMHELAVSKLQHVAPTMRNREGQ